MGLITEVIMWEHIHAMRIYIIPMYSIDSIFSLLLGPEHILVLV